ncbi:lectin-like domain-containing protein [Lentilactobacillus hilgardii]|uniref:lectin-like domain-containing protein n=1 Tax=Lentilactobacillus hilgardii TaxID=1588 RepID=UPI0039EB83E9
MTNVSSLSHKGNKGRLVKIAAIFLFSTALGTFAINNASNSEGTSAGPLTTVLAKADTSQSQAPTEPYQYFSTATSTGSSRLNAKGYASLTQGQANQYGYATTLQKLDFTHDFTVSGDLYFGSKQNGGDALNILFSHEKPASTLKTSSSTGGFLGMDGLSDAFGLVFDEHYNTDSVYGDFQNKQWWQLDRTDPVVSWRSTDYNGDLNSNARIDNGLGFASAKSQDPDAQVVSMNPDMIDGKAHPFTINYNASTSTITINVADNSYSPALGRSQQLVYTNTGANSSSTWTRVISQNDKTNGLYLSFSGVTGGSAANRFAVTVSGAYNLSYAGE